MKHVRSRFSGTEEASGSRTRSTFLQHDGGPHLLPDHSRRFFGLLDHRYEFDCLALENQSILHASCHRRIGLGQARLSQQRDVCEYLSISVQWKLSFSSISILPLPMVIIHSEDDGIIPYYHTRLVSSLHRG